MASIQKPKGTLDILPQDMPVWNYIENAAREQCRLFGFHEIRFPTFESTDLFCRGVGNTTDVVQKEMYAFIDKDGSSLSLRPEGTACIARSVIENGLYAGTMPLKLFYFTNFFRRERPQAGRSREFWQFGTELYGSDKPEADATVIALADGFLKRIGLSGVELKINTVGCEKCRPAYRQALKEYFAQYADKLCDTCRQRLETNPLRILDCKCPDCIAIAENAPRTVDYVCDDCKSKFDSLLSLLGEMGVKYTADPKVVRGLDYYSGAVFEFIAGGIGAQSAVAGGGRYDGLTDQIGGHKLPAVGFAMGVTRLIACLKNEGLMPEEPSGPDIYIASLGERAAKFAQITANKLRQNGISAEADICGRSLKAQMKYADKQKARYVMVIGDNELDQSSAILQDMRSENKIKTDLSIQNIINIIGQ